MPFTHKLSRRLAVLRALPPHWVVLPTLALIAACSAGVPTGVDTSLNPADAPIVVNPRSLILEANQVSVFKAYATGVPGDSLVTSIEWTATGGNISLNGTYSSSSLGDFKVVGKRHGPTKTTSDTATVTIVQQQPSITAVMISPTSASVEVQKQQTFSAVGKLSDGSIVAIGVTWSATGGSIDAGGVYTAGTTPGTYRVIAQAASANVADTVPVTVTSAVFTSGPLTPNMPFGFTVPTGFARDFNADPEGAYLEAGGLSIVDGSTYNPGSGVAAPGVGPASPNKIGVSVFNAGFPSGSGPTTAYIPGATMSPYNWRQVYVAIWVQLSSNWVGEPSGCNKVIIGSIHNSPSLVLSASGSGTGNLQWSMRLQNLGVGTSAINVPNIADATVTRGQWQRVEFLAKANTPGVQDGVVQVWVTNYNSSGQIVKGPTLVTNANNIGWSAAGQGNTWGNMQWQDIWGGNTPGATVPATQYMFMDKMVVAGM